MRTWTNRHDGSRVDASAAMSVGAWLRRSLATPQKLLLSLIACKVISGIHRKKTLGLGLVVRREMLLELSIQLLSKFVVLTWVKCDLLHKTLCKNLGRGRIGGITKMSRMNSWSSTRGVWES